MKEPTKPRKPSLRVTLAIFSGEDKDYVAGHGRGAKNMFASIGLFVILIFVGCLLSAYFFFSSLMQGNVAVSLPVGIFWGLLVVNMYLLLLYTISPAILPNKNNSSGGGNSLFTFSMFLRMGFMSLLAVITAQPLNVELFSSSVDASLKRHIQEERAKMIVSADRFLISEEVKDSKDFRQQIALRDNTLENADRNLSQIYQKVADDSLFLKKSESILKKLDKLESHLFLSKKEKMVQSQLLSKLDDLIENEIQSDRDAQEFLVNTTFQDIKIREFNAKLSKAIASKLKNYDDLNLLLSKSNFYIKRVQLIFYECPLSFFSTSFVCFLFLFPILLKYRVRKLSNYYARKIVNEKQHVEEIYGRFKLKYAEELRKNVDTFKFSSQARIKWELEKLRKVSYSRYMEIEKEISEEYQTEVFSKYEYWMDNPFRTTRKPKIKREMQTHIALMDLLHAKPEKDDE